MATMNTADIGFEREIWKAADKMRGNIDASEYKSVVLGLIFLKYISDKFETKYRQLVAEGEGFEEDKDEYTAENIFYVPTEARWERIAAEAHTPEIGQVIDNAMRAIEKENKRLKDILPKNFARPELDKRRWLICSRISGCTNMATRKIFWDAPMSIVFRNLPRRKGNSPANSIRPPVLSKRSLCFYHKSLNKSSERISIHFTNFSDFAL